MGTTARLLDVHDRSIKDTKSDWYWGWVSNCQDPDLWSSVGFDSVVFLHKLFYIEIKP